jgi:hypothetical protein
LNKNNEICPRAAQLLHRLSASGAENIGNFNHIGIDDFLVFLEFSDRLCLRCDWTAALAQIVSKLNIRPHVC